jgi:hypothetical protein
VHFQSFSLSIRIWVSLMYICNRQQIDFCKNIPGSGQCPHNKKCSNIIARNINWFLPSGHSVFEMDNTNTSRCYGHEQGLISDKHHQSPRHSVHDQGLSSDRHHKHSRYCGHEQGLSLDRHHQHSKVLWSWTGYIFR